MPRIEQASGETLTSHPIHPLRLHHPDELFVDADLRREGFIDPISLRERKLMSKNAEAVIVIEMLNDFVTGKLRCEQVDHIIPNLRKLLAAARKQGVHVVYSSDAHLKEDSELRVWGEHAMKGTKGAEVIPE